GPTLIYIRRLCSFFACSAGNKKTPPPRPPPLRVLRGGNPLRDLPLGGGALPRCRAQWLDATAALELFCSLSAELLRPTIMTGHGASRATFSATLPRKKRLTPLRPWDVSTIRSHPSA